MSARRTLTGVSALLLGAFGVIVVPSRAVLSQGYSPEDAVQRMTVADGFAVELVAAEPLVRQPVAIDFDDRGRLWVLQYLQYPNPAGLKRVKFDRYSRTTYDRVPEPPPHGPRGADRLTILEDTDGDGRVDSSKDFLSNLNLATGFAFGYGGVFVLQTPYLLFYPDRNRDDIPDSAPEVLLRGFGMEDTSSLANSLTWGPDGWLYGTQGTNLTANIRGIAFEQGLWRYHPTTKVFELFSEGGSNMWGLDFDRHGNLLAGTNYGGFLMFHAVQGAYYQKSFAKHGQLHNPFAFGYFGHVPHRNFQGGHVTVGGIIYQADAFPPQFRDTYIAVDTLGHAVRWHHVTPHGSTFQSVNGGVLLQANDSWFAPSDAAVGPDGAVYIADWYDQRTAHPDPDATWDRSNGRIYRLRWNASHPSPHVDPQSLSSEQLLGWLVSPNQWMVRRARRVLAERNDSTIVPQLRTLWTNAEDDDNALQMLWTLHAVGGLDAQVVNGLLEHRAAPLRAWTVRLLADHTSTPTKESDAIDATRNDTSREPASPAKASSPEIRLRKETLTALVELAASDTSPIVIRQLASTAQRLPAKPCIRIARSIAARAEFSDDPYIPLLIWWAVERHAISSADLVLAEFANSEAWKVPLVRDALLGRLMRRLAGDGSPAGYLACARLLTCAPNPTERRRMINELDAGLKMVGRHRLPRLPLPESSLAIKRTENDVEANAGRARSLPIQLADALAADWSDDTTDPLLIRVAIRLGRAGAVERAVAVAMDQRADVTTRSSMLAILQELGDATSCVEPALNLVAGSEPNVIRLAALALLGRFSDTRIAVRLLAGYPTLPGPLRRRARDILLSRPESALAFLRNIDRGTLDRDDVTTDDLRQVAVHNNHEIDAIVQKHWGAIRAGTSEEKLAEIRRINNDLRAAAGSGARGKLVFEKQCASCHKLFDQGTDIGPDLTKANRKDRDFLLVSIVDPSAQIRKEYLSYLVVTVDGRVVTGLLADETPTSVTVLDAKNQRTVVARDEVEQVKVSPVSLMPENMLRELTPQQVRDLLSYLQSG